MIEVDCSPFIIRVAVSAIRTVMAIVLIIFEMATDTCRFVSVAERVFAVTIVAGQQGVLSYQRKFRIAGVIKSRLIPGNRAVTVFALLAATPFVKIVIRMATETRRLRDLQRSIFVAISAGGLQVIAN